LDKAEQIANRGPTFEKIAIFDPSSSIARRMM